MGAFVAQKVSPFLRRRKGRVGLDVWAEKTAPTFAGAEINSAAGNYLCMICAPNASGTWQHNDTQGEGAWVSHSMPALAFIGNSALTRGHIIDRPFFEKLDIELWHLQCSFAITGIITGTGGGIWYITPDGKTVFAITSVAGVPQEAVAFEDNGRYCIVVGALSGPNMLGRGGEFFSPNPISIPSEPGSLGFRSATFLPDSLAAKHAQGSPPRSRTTPVFLCGDTSTGQPIRKLHRKADTTWEQYKQDTNPSTGNEITSWLILPGRCLVVGVSSNATGGLRSVDGATTWEAISPNAGPINGVWNYGNRLYCITRDAPRFLVSYDWGKTWAASTALPSGTAVPSQHVFHYEKRFVFCHDGAVNRLYTMRNYGEI